MIHKFQGGVWFVDFEFHSNGREGNPPVPVCMVAQELLTGKTLRLWQDDLSKLKTAPFPTGETSLLVSYYASAEMGCFLSLGWSMPKNVLDLFISFRILTNGKPLPAGNGLLGALVWFGIDGLAASEKDSMRNLIMNGGPWNAGEKRAILEYCESDVVALQRLYSAMDSYIDWPRALLQGQYAVAVAAIENYGVPIDVDTLTELKEKWHGIQLALISEVDKDFGVFQDSVFKSELFGRYLIERGIEWPRHASGSLDLQDDTFRDMTGRHPDLYRLYELRRSLSQLRLSDLAVGEDGRNRCLLSMFRSKTGRNQPSNSKFIFGPSVWLRGLIKPNPGFGLAYIDWSQQEFGIAAALSDDQNMLAAYKSGDPYLTFAKQAGAVPGTATKHTHSSIREQFKACVLAVQYGMGAENLAYRLGRPVERARQLLALHQRTYKAYWRWSEAVLNQALLGDRLWTAFGWQISTEVTQNARSLCNFPMQANGAEMLRLACTRLIRDGVRICAPVHDAILIEAPLGELSDVIHHSQNIMRQASAVVLGGFELESDVKIVAAPNRFMDERGVDMWNRVMRLGGMADRAVEKNMFE